MAAFNMTSEMAQEYYRATDVGAHPPVPRPIGYVPFVTRVTQSCALCSVPIDISHCTPDQYEATLAAHHAVCERRPVEVGDYVEACLCGDWNTRGAVVSGVPGCEQMFAVAVDSGPDGTIGKRLEFGHSGLRRIPRPGASEQEKREPKVGDRVRIVRCCLPELNGQSGTVARVDSTLLTQMPFMVDTEGCTHAWCYEVEPLRPMEGDRVPLQPRGGQHDPAPPRCACGEDHPPCEAHARHRHTKQAGPFVDGLTVAECDSRWSSNRYRLEAGLPQHHALTAAQIAAGRAAWQARNHPLVSTLVRERVAAGREAERNRVRVEVQDVD